MRSKSPLEQVDKVQRHLAADGQRGALTFPAWKWRRQTQLHESLTRSRWLTRPWTCLESAAIAQGDVKSGARPLRRASRWARRPFAAQTGHFQSVGQCEVHRTKVGACALSCPNRPAAWANRAARRGARHGHWHSGGNPLPTCFSPSACRRRHHRQVRRLRPGVGHLPSA